MPSGCITITLLVFLSLPAVLNKTIAMSSEGGKSKVYATTAQIVSHLAGESLIYTTSQCQSECTYSQSERKLSCKGSNAEKMNIGCVYYSIEDSVKSAFYVACYEFNFEWDTSTSKEAECERRANELYKSAATYHEEYEVQIPVANVTQPAPKIITEPTQKNVTEAIAKIITESIGSKATLLTCLLPTGIAIALLAAFRVAILLCRKRKVLCFKAKKRENNSEDSSVESQEESHPFIHQINPAPVNQGRNADQQNGNPRSSNSDEAVRSIAAILSFICHALLILFTRANLNQRNMLTEVGEGAAANVSGSKDRKGCIAASTQPPNDGNLDDIDVATSELLSISVERSSSSEPSPSTGLVDKQERTGKAQLRETSFSSDTQASSSGTQHNYPQQAQVQNGNGRGMNEGMKDCTRRKRGYRERQASYPDTTPWPESSTAENSLPLHNTSIRRESPNGFRTQNDDVSEHPESPAGGREN